MSKHSSLLLNLLSGDGVGLVAVEDKELAVAQDESASISSLKGRGRTVVESRCDIGALYRKGDQRRSLRRPSMEI